MKLKIAVLAGDGIGPEVTREATQILKAVAEFGGHEFTFTEALIGGVAITANGMPLPQSTIDVCLESNAVLLGAVGGLILTWLLKTRASKIAAVILLVWIVLELVMRLLQAPPGAWVFGIMFTLCAVNGVRAAFAKFRPTGTADVKTFS